jgi:hypothetical protein
MEYAMISGEIPYSGKELRSGWVRTMTGLGGDAAAGFIGPCRVENEDLVDKDDARAGEHIESELMAHIIIEHPGCTIETAVLRQRFLIALLCEILWERGCRVRRDGDDVYQGERKLTVSIAAPSAASCLIHLGVNIRPRGAPVPAVGLEELRVPAAPLVSNLLDRYKTELKSCRRAEKKVRRVP